MEMRRIPGNGRGGLGEVAVIHRERQPSKRVKTDKERSK